MTAGDGQAPLGRATGPTAADVMTTDLVVLTEHDSVAAAWELLARGQFHHLPVVRGRRCVGVLDDGALLRAWRPGTLGRARQPLIELLAPEVHTVVPGTPLGALTALMAEHRIDAVPVVDEEGDLVGLVTATDVVAATASLLTGA